MSPTLRSPAKELGPRASRTIARILEATRSIFLTRGYAGTTVDEIAKVAGLSRASFYTYFPTKRDVLLALGTDSARAGSAVIDSLGRLCAGWTEADIAAFVADYFAMLDDHGAFAFAWTQAAHEDVEIRNAGRKGHLVLCRKLGDIAGALRGEPYDDPTGRGLVIFSMLERGWSYCRLYEGNIDEELIRREIASMLATTIRPTR